MQQQDCRRHPDRYPTPAAPRADAQSGAVGDTDIWNERMCSGRCVCLSLFLSYRSAVRLWLAVWGGIALHQAIIGIIQDTQLPDHPTDKARAQGQGAKGAVPLDCETTYDYN